VHCKLNRRVIYIALCFAGVTPISFAEWEKIDREEKSRGEQCGKPREKFANVNDMLKYAWD